MSELESVYERFKEKLVAMAGECYRVEKAGDIGLLLMKLFQAKGVKDIALLESPLTKAANLHKILQDSGLTVYTENFRNITPMVNVGVSELNWAIAELGTLVQIGTDVNQRLVSMLPPIHVALIQTSKLIPTLMETLSTIHKLPEIPGFIGFVTGPSRTADIERVLTIGVHGPAQLIVIFVDEEAKEVN